MAAYFPAAAPVELRNEHQEAVLGGVDVGSQFYDLVLDLGERIVVLNGIGNGPGVGTTGGTGLRLGGL